MDEKGLRNKFSAGIWRDLVFFKLLNLGQGSKGTVHII